MQTMEQALADLTLRHIVTVENAFSRTSRPDQLLQLLERGGMSPFELQSVTRNLTPLAGAA
jgi:hypothetical protein